MEHETSRETPPEIPLLGRRLTPGIVRIGNAIHRPSKNNASFVHELLLWLEQQGFEFAPRFLGGDEQGRDILTYLEGQTWPGSGATLPDELLVQAAQVIRRYHDLTAGCKLSQGHEIVAHHELGPRSTIFQENRLIGLIDWDDAAPRPFLTAGKKRTTIGVLNSVACFAQDGEKHEHIAILSNVWLRHSSAGNQLPRLRSGHPC